MKIEFISNIIARIPYGVRCKAPDSDYPLRIFSIGYDESGWFVQFSSGLKLSQRTPLNEIKLYLRSMSSMTEEEKKEYDQLCYNCQDQDPVDYNITELDRTQLIYVIDWLNKHHFDYLGLIEMGLAIEAPIDLYKN